MTKRFELRLENTVVAMLEKEAKQRHISVQDLIRSVILPDWSKNWRPEN